ncbi:MAG TPA: divergent polysaccharide deacetylase family protein [Deltaproteobacteria bacterium]|nr:divergent polysaccharide deacetylase family protein [Deltaproteobacteria bacterium]
MKKKKQQRRTKKKIPVRLLVLSIVFVFIVGVAFGVFFFSGHEEPPPETGRTVKSPVTRQFVPPAPTPVTPETVGPFREEPVPTTALMAIVIDDIGYDLSIVDELLSLNIAINFAILPHCPFSVQSACKAYEAGHEIILHLPMEPHDYPEKNPGEGALFVNMTQQEMMKLLQKNLRAVPNISGVNNHMGSRFMEDGGKLAVLFAELKKRDLYFLDSLTTEHSKGRAASRTVGIDFISRDTFMDNNHDETDTFQILKHLLDNKNSWDRIVVIGHPYPGTVRAIRRILPFFNDYGIKPVYLSSITGH